MRAILNAAALLLCMADYVKRDEIYPKVRFDCEKVPFAEEGIVICMRF